MRVVSAEQRARVIWALLIITLITALTLSGLEGELAGELAGERAGQPGRLFMLRLSTLLLLIATAARFDKAKIKARGEIGRRLPLTLEGVKALNEHLQGRVTLCHESEHPRELVLYEERGVGELKGEMALDEGSLERVVSALRGLGDQLWLEESSRSAERSASLHLELSLEEHLEAVTLPHLPLLGGRAQLGLVTRESVPRGARFLWESDLGVARAEARGALPSEVNMNRRTLVSEAGLELFQGAGSEQRSNASVLGNFYWCHSESTRATQGRLLIYPPNYLGQANCEYITTLSAEGYPCSALRTLRALDQGEPLLMFTGSTRQTLMVWLRVSLAELSLLIAPAVGVFVWWVCLFGLR